MILPDVNLLLYAYKPGIAQHPAARRWLEALLSSPSIVGIPWAVALGFIRVGTSRLFEDPFTPEEAISCVRSWLGRRNVRIPQPGPRHLDLVEELVKAAGVAGRLTTDAHLAALAIEHGATLHSADLDFGRFPGLQWENPLAA